MSVGPEFMALLEKTRAALSHSHPNASREELFAECMKDTLAAHAKRVRGETSRPREPAMPPMEKPSRYVPRPVRRAVFERAGARCTFVAEDGTRCAATHRLELHHVIPHALGGLPTVENLKLTCNRHNGLLARRDYGVRLIDDAQRARSVSR